MARTSTVSSAHADISTRVTGENEIAMQFGDVWVYVSREEAAQLAVDLLNAAEAKPVDVEVAA